MQNLVRILLGSAILVSALIVTTPASLAATSVTKSSSCKARGLGEKHAVATVFFAPNIRNVIATSNEYQEMDGLPHDTNPTDLHFDVYLGNGAKPGKCLGSIDVHIDANTNERVEFEVEKMVSAVNGEGVGLLVRRGKMDVRKKFDIYVDIMKDGKRYIIWNNFVGLPNKSREMSPMRFVAGHHLLINYTGGNANGAEAQIQLFKNDGSFVGVAVEKIGPHSVVVTDSVRALAFKDLNGKAVPAQMLPADGGGYMKITGPSNVESERGTVNLYTPSVPNSNASQTFRPSKLIGATITWSRRNASLGPLALGK